MGVSKECGEKGKGRGEDGESHVLEAADEADSR